MLGFGDVYLMMKIYTGTKAYPHLDEPQSLQVRHPSW
jgi:hypothetical protein